MALITITPVWMEHLVLYFYGRCRWLDGCRNPEISHVGCHCAVICCPSHYNNQKDCNTNNCQLELAHAKFIFNNIIFHSVNPVLTLFLHVSNPFPCLNSVSLFQNCFAKSRTFTVDFLSTIFVIMSWTSFFIVSPIFTEISGGT